MCEASPRDARRAAREPCRRWRCRAPPGSSARPGAGSGRCVGRIARNTRARDARRIADECRRAAVDVIAVAGGDGTLNEVCQAYLDWDGQPVAGPPLALLPIGTGGDFRRTLGSRRRRRPRGRARPQRGAARLRPRRAAADDARRRDRASRVPQHHELRPCRPDRSIVNAGPKWLGGRAAFYLATVRALATCATRSCGCESTARRGSSRPWST